MFVRIFDSQRNIYFRSEVYAIINSGWYEKRLVVFSSDDGSYFKFFDCIDKSDPTEPKILINSIISDGFNSAFEWILKSNDDVDKQLEDYANFLYDDIRFFEYSGYQWIYENKSLLTELLKGSAVSTKGYEHQMLALNAYQLEGWYYIKEQKDIDFTLEQTYGFHDSVLKGLNYISGAYVDNENAMYCLDSKRSVTMYFDSQWCSNIEMVFEGVTALNLRPYSDNESSSVYSASLFLRDACIFFCDGEMNDIDKTYDGTWIESYGLRWRFYK